MKRFYKQVTIEAVESGFEIALDGRILKTPMKTTLILPTQALAKAVAAEWDAQEGDIKPETMPLTKLSNTAIDRVHARRAEVVEEVSGFGGSDLICYRAENPDTLVDLQEKTWGPYVKWVKDTYGVELIVTAGIIHVKQNDHVLAALTRAVESHGSFHLNGLHALTTGLGSLVLGLAYSSGHATFDNIWAASQLDELYQEGEWGTDAEAVAMREVLRDDMEMACRYIEML